MIRPAPSKRSVVRNVPQPCHIVRSTTVNDGSPQSRCPVQLGYCYTRSDLETRRRLRPPLQSSAPPSQAQVKGEICLARQVFEGGLNARLGGRQVSPEVPSALRAPPETITIQRCPCPRSPSALKTTEHPRSANHSISSTMSTTAPSQARRRRTVAHQMGAASKADGRAERIGDLVDREIGAS